MKERPILFNTAMVQAILCGRKTQTRRLVSAKHVDAIEFMGGSDDEGNEFDFAAIHCGHPIDDDGNELPKQWMAYCTEYPEEGSIPIGHGPGLIGDRLWVRETFGDCGVRLTYKADTDDGAGCMVKRWTPSIHMPRSASRIILEITNVRVERLHDLSESDAAAEGLSKPIYVENQAGYLTPPHGETLLSAFPTARHWFSTVWDGFYGNWSANPWVWVVEFKVLTTNGEFTS